MATNNDQPSDEHEPDVQFSPSFRAKRRPSRRLTAQLADEEFQALRNMPQSEYEQYVENALNEAPQEPRGRIHIMVNYVKQHKLASILLLCAVCIAFMAGVKMADYGDNNRDLLAGVHVLARYAYYDDASRMKRRADADAAKTASYKGPYSDLIHHEWKSTKWRQEYEDFITSFSEFPHFVNQNKFETYLKTKRLNDMPLIHLTIILQRHVESELNEISANTKLWRKPIQLAKKTGEFDPRHKDSRVSSIKGRQKLYTIQMNFGNFLFDDLRLLGRMQHDQHRNIVFATSLLRRASITTVVSRQSALSRVKKSMGDAPNAPEIETKLKSTFAFLDYLNEKIDGGHYDAISEFDPRRQWFAPDTKYSTATYSSMRRENAHDLIEYFREGLNVEQGGGKSNTQILGFELGNIWTEFQDVQIPIHQSPEEPSQKKWGSGDMRAHHEGFIGFVREQAIRHKTGLLLVGGHSGWIKDFIKIYGRKFAKPRDDYDKLSSNKIDNGEVVWLEVGVSLNDFAILRIVRCQNPLCYGAEKDETKSKDAAKGDAGDRDATRQDREEKQDSLG